MGSDRWQFSPSTRYRDYAISRTMFHWESQSATREHSKRGHRYIRHRQLGWTTVLFVGGTSRDAFLCCGPVQYLRHQKERPIQITWRLGHELPERFFEVAAAAVA